MAKFELKFIDFTDDSAFIKVEKVIVNENDCKLSAIQISGKDELSGDFNIWLDKSTAIKFAKTLRTEINKITESEENNV